MVVSKGHRGINTKADIGTGMSANYEKCVSFTKHSKNGTHCVPN